MRIALVHDYLVQYGGGERVLEALCELFPRAPIYTLVYDEKNILGAFKDRMIRTSFLQKIPLARSKHRLFPLLMPLAIEEFDLGKYDLVISSSNSYAKGINTTSTHICYCHTPMRYAWDDCHKYLREFGYPSILKKIVPFAMNYIRVWDRISAERVDHYIANSRCVANRIKKYYRKDSNIIYPPVDISRFRINSKIENYFLIVSRLLPYKRFDIAIQAFKKLGAPLKIIGEGPDEKRLKKMAHGANNIEFLGRLPDNKVVEYFSKCQAFIFPSEEDFGIVQVEAMASGRPVIAYRAGGALEIVEEKKTGLFFNEQTPESLEQALIGFKSVNFDPDVIRESAKRFNKDVFKKKFKEFIEGLVGEISARQSNIAYTSRTKIEV